VILQKGALAVVYGEEETSRFLAAVQRLKRQLKQQQRQARLARLRARSALRKQR
jgi:hypothetical protein